MRFALAAVGLLLLAGCVVPDADETGTEAPTESPGSISSSQASDGTSPSPTSTSPPAGADSAVMVRLHRWVWVNRTSGDQAPYGEFGHHCGGGTWTEQPPAVTVYDWSWQSSGTTSSGPSDPWPSSGILAVSYESPQDPSFSRVGSGPTLHGFEARDGSFGVPAVFHQHGTVANLTARGGALSVEGTLLALGVPATLDREYDFSSGESSYHVHERLRFTLLGDAEVRVEPKGHPCI